MWIPQEKLHTTFAHVVVADFACWIQKIGGYILQAQVRGFDERIVYYTNKAVKKEKKQSGPDEVKDREGGLCIRIRGMGRLEERWS